MKFDKRNKLIIQSTITADKPLYSAESWQQQDERTISEILKEAEKIIYNQTINNE